MVGGVGGDFSQTRVVMIRTFSVSLVSRAKAKSEL